MAATATLPTGMLSVDNGQISPDPFTASAASSDTNRHRYSGLDAQYASLYANGSPAQTKRALEAHMAETERRLQEASKLGQILVKQRAELADRLRDVDDQQEEDEVPAELRSRLLQLEREVNDVTRETARAFLSKSRASSGEAAAEASVFSSDANHSPTKVHPPPSRKQRNQAPSRANDVKLATEISTSLLNQIRELQAAYAEKDEALKTSLAETAQLAMELDGARQRLRVTNENEQKARDENWILETQMHEITASQKELSDREHKLQQNLKAAAAQNTSILREFEELKQAHGKLTEDHAAVRKQHESEVITLKRNVANTEGERDVLQRKMEELTSQNKELAKAVTYRMASAEYAVPRDDAADDDNEDDGRLTPDHSPPGSPNKATPRHGALESETLKSSLHHAHRMIQNLKNNIHREKTEKIELRRLLQEARDELESRRGQAGIDSTGKKRKQNEKDIFKKPLRPGALGAARSGRENVLMDDPDWEDQDGSETPSKRPMERQTKSDRLVMPGSYGTDAETAGPDTSDVFETAQSATDTEAFQTVAETLGGESSEDMTETESNARQGRPVGVRPPPSSRLSFQSTASTSGDDENTMDVRTPIQTQPRYRLRISRGANRRSTVRSSEIAGTPPSAGLNIAMSDSPASIGSSSSAPAPGQSLFAELGNLSDVETEEGTPRSTSMLSPKSPPESTARKSPAARSGLRTLSYPVQPKVEMVEAGVMTEPWEPQPNGTVSSAPAVVGAALAGGFAFGLASDSSSKDIEQLEQPPAVAAAQQPNPAAPKTLIVAPPQSLSYSPVISQSQEPAKPTTQPLRPATVATYKPAPPTAKAATLQLSYSPVVTIQETQPAAPVLVNPKPLMDEQRLQTVEPARPQTAKKLDEAADGTPTVTPAVTPTREPARPRSAKSNRGFLGTVFRRSKVDKDEAPFVADTNTSPSQDKENGLEAPSKAPRDGRIPFQPVEANSLPHGTKKQEPSASPPKLPSTSTEGTQTLLSAEDLDRMMKAKAAVPAPQESTKPMASPTRPGVTASSPRKARDSISSESRNRRTGGLSSVRARSSTPPPPLPIEARQVIAAATQRVPGTTPAVTPVTTMGPPTVPASAYRTNRESYRPRTPQYGAGAAGSPASQHTIRASQQTYIPRGDAASPATTRRSSVSSFASELDHRFNIRPAADAHGFDPHTTDPRMIQAITQTMIGEYLWKYTRKAGREQMSSSRHRRFFWVHPYTRTLYWSEQDPSTAGRAQLKAKSVAIEAVRVVTDDNPMPPGLHRKSLVVLTPGRSLMFTAATSQRHETWFNALSYLLLRTNAERDGEDGEITTEDVDEFNPGGFRSASRATGRSRASVVPSYASRTTARTISPERRQPTLVARHSAAASQRGSRTQSVPPQSAGSQSGRWSSLSGRLSTSFRGSFSSRHGGPNAGDLSMYETAPQNGAHDSAEDLRQVIAAQERDADRIENVRACCDGKHDVGSLSRTSRASSRAHRQSITSTIRSSYRGHDTSRPQSSSAMDPASIAS